MFSKQDVEFEHPAKGDEHCNACRHFEIRHPEACEIVEGKIEGYDWCIMYNIKQRQQYAGISGKEAKSSVSK